MSLPTLVKRFSISRASGYTNPESFFDGRVVRVDRDFRKLIETAGEKYYVDHLDCKVFQTHTGSNTDKIITESLFLDISKSPDTRRICAILAYLGKEDFSLLEIPEGKREIQLILGYVSVSSKWSVLYLEHEKEGGVSNEVHLHVRSLNRWGNKTPMVLKF
ncbi:MAG: hypothetical protein WCP17_00660 [bacterium]